MFYMHGDGAGWGWWLLMLAGMVALWALIVYGVLQLTRDRVPLRSREPREPQTESPRSILERRLATGELSIDEYQRLRGVLEQGSGKSAAPPPDAEPRPGSA